MELSYAADNLVLSLHKREKRQTSEAGLSHDDADEAPVKLKNLRRQPVRLAAHRIDLSVYYRRLQREEFLTLSAIREGKPLGEALETAFAESHIPDQNRAHNVQTWFSTWAQLGWLCAPESIDSGSNAPSS